MRAVGPFAALGHRFTVEVTDADVAAGVDELFGHLGTEAASTARYGLEPSAAGWGLVRDGASICTDEKLDMAVEMLVWDVNRRAVASRPDRPVVHGAALERDGIGVVLVGASGSGKSTLAASLLLRGLRYLTDEAVAIDPESGLIEPFPKAITLVPGSWPWFSELDQHRARFGVDRWHVPPPAVRVGALAPTTRPRVLVMLGPHDPGAPATLRPLHRAAALVRLAGQTFDFHDDGSRRLQQLAKVVRGCACYELAGGDVGSTARAVLDVLAGRAGRG